MTERFQHCSKRRAEAACEVFEKTAKYLTVQSSSIFGYSTDGWRFALKGANFTFALGVREVLKGG